MTEPITQSDDPVQRPAGGGGFAATIAPEGVAAVLAIALVAALLTVRLAGLGASGLAPTPRPSEGASPGPSVAPPAVDRVAINTVLGVNQNLLVYGQTLQLELDKPPVDTTSVKLTMGQMSVQLLAAEPAVTRLEGEPPTAMVATDVAAVYTELRAEIAQANDHPRNDETAWRAGAVSIVDTLKALPAIDLRLEALRAGLPDPNAPVASGPPSVAPESALPSASPVVTAPPTAPPTNPPTAPPTAGATVPPSGFPSPASTPPLAEPNQLQNPGFESGSDSWQLVKANQSFGATLTLDPASPFDGKTSARIDIGATDGLAQSISLQQTGVILEQGAKYRVSMALRASVDRQVRVRVTPATPPFTAYGSGRLDAGTAWSVQTFEFTTSVGGSGRLFSIELGETGGSVWIDDVSIARVSPFAP